MKTCAGDGSLHRSADQFGGAGMRRMCFNNHRTAGGEGRRRIAACNREGEGKVGCPEHRDRTDRNVSQLEIRFGDRHAGRITRIETKLLEAPIPNFPSE
jgi:hypothetical protein